MGLTYESILVEVRCDRPGCHTCHGIPIRLGDEGFLSSDVDAQVRQVLWENAGWLVEVVGDDVFCTCPDCDEEILEAHRKECE